MTQFVSIHGHSGFSLLDGHPSPTNMVARAVELGQPAIAVTDHGVMHGAIELYREGFKAGIKPIIGCEAYLKDKVTTDHLKDFVSEADGDYKVKGLFHQLILAMNPVGYRNLCKLTSIAHLTEDRGQKQKKADTSTRSKSWMFWEELEQYNEGLIVTSGCMAGLIPQALRAGDMEYAEAIARRYHSIFGDRFYIEIQDHNAPDGGEPLNVQLVALAQKLNIELVATADNHYTSPCQKQAHDALLCINTGKLLTDENRMRYEGAYWLPTGDEMVERLSRYLPHEVAVRAVENTVAIANRVEDYQLKRKPTPPKFPIPDGYKDADDYLTQLSHKGLDNRLNGNISQEYSERLEYELGVIKQMGFSQYFLVVEDFCSFARSKDIWLGIGRGSVGGCLVAYALGITNIDPVHHGLLFERFLNPCRVSMPDIDTDVCKERRPEVIAYIQEKYGFDHVAQIATFNKMVSASAFKDVGRTMNASFTAANYISKQIPVVRGKPAKLSKLIEKRDLFPEFYDAYQNDDKFTDKEGKETVSFKEWVDLAIAIEGTVKSIGIHAAGVVAGWCPIDEIVPLMKGKNGEVVAQYCDKDLEEIGLIKIDILGLKTLTVMRKAVESANRCDEPVSLEDISYNDKRVFHYMASGKTEGLFQFEGYGGKLLKDIGVDSLDKVSAANTLNRPQCIDPKIDIEFIRRNAGLDRVSYLVPALEPILKETLGLPIYQEQLLKICQVIAGFSLGEADNIRRGIGKKKREIIDALKVDFLKGCTNNWYDESVGNDLWSIIEAGADYGFNKSHSMAYGIIAYQTAWLKYYHLPHFMAALCSMEDEKEKLLNYLVKCKFYKITLLPPSINKSARDFAVVDEATIRWGLRSLEGLGEAALNPIILERQLRPFEDFQDFYTRTLPDCDALTALIKSGALDELHSNRAEMLAYLEPLKKWRTQSRTKTTRTLNWEKEAKELAAADFDVMDADAMKKHLKRIGQVQKNLERAMSIDTALPLMPIVEDWTHETRLKNEKEVLGMYASGHPLDKYPVGCEPFSNIQPKKVFISTVQVNSAREANSKQGIMMYAEIEDKNSDTMTLKLFNKEFKVYGHLFKPDAHVSITAKAQEWNGRLELILQVALKPTSPEGEQPVEAVVGAWEDDEF